ncbi:MAG: formylglycine-generating enzyme family protein, partial [Gemmataceae bacterium]|nr:formylglycine-generating enzyme family protein [Gemmataceae bacterium]
PTAAQLDHAAGDLGPGPAAVGRRGKGPAPVDSGEYADVSPRGVRNLAGNGWEWTSDDLRAGEETVAVLRGQPYSAQGKLTPARLKEMATDGLAPTQYPEAASPFTGFRVAVSARIP